MEVPLHGLLKTDFCKLTNVKSSRYFFYCMLVITLFISNVLKAQVATNYIFSQSNQTYKSDTSTTSTIPAAIFTTGWDDLTYTTYKFPFNFTYNGVLYTGGASTIGLDTDGWIAFSTTGTIAMTGTTAGGSWVSASDHTGVYLWGTGNNNGIAGFNSDMEDQTWTTFTGNTTNGSQQVTNVSDFSNLRVGTRLVAAGITDGTIITKINNATASFTMSAVATATATAVSFTPRTSIYAFTRGTAPYRQFVVQWTRVTRFGTPGDDFSFQIVLNEGGGNPVYQTLQTVYGTCKATNTTAQNSQVGLRGATAADFNARKETANWSATTAATVNTDLCTLTPAVFPATGLTFTWSPACPAAPSNAGGMSGPTAVCPGTTVDYSIPGVPGAIFYTWTYTGTNTTYSGTTTLPINTLDFDITATGGPYTLTVTPGNLCGAGLPSSINITLGGLPTASISYSSLQYCTNASPVTPTIVGTAGGTFTASPGGLTINASTGQVTPATSTPGSYVITYTFTSGCTATATANITINTLPSATATATPSVVCTSPNSSQLLASASSGSNYSVNSIAYTSLTPSAGSTVLWNTYQLDNISTAIAMPFTFNFYGSPITNFYVSTEGYVQLQTGTAVAWTPQTLPNATAPNNIIALAWADLIVDPSTNPGSSVRYFVNGAAGSRVLVIDYINLRFLVGSGAQNVTGQIRLYESDSHIEVAAGSVFDNGDDWEKTMGIENSTGTQATTPPGRNNTIWNTTNEAWSFTQTGSYTYSWSPGTSLSSTTIANPVITNLASTTTYTVVVTNPATGCTATGSTTVSVGGMGGTYTVGVGGNYTTLTAAVAAYNSACISSSVVFSLIDNTYPGETFPIVINSNIYQSASKTLTIKPAVSKTPVITGSSTVAIIKLNGADYVTIDGSNAAGGTTKDLSLINTSTNASTSTIVWLNSVDATNGATNNTLKNCVITGNTPTTTFTSVLSSGASVGTVAEAANSNNTYQNNLLTKCQTAMAFVGPTGNETGNIITGNTIGSVTAANKLGWSGIEVYQQANCQVTNNTIFGITSSDFIVTSGISVYGTASGITISGNKISDIKNTEASLGWGANGIYLGSSSTAANVNVINNFVFDIAAFGYTGSRYEEDNGYGIIVAFGGGYNVYHNTVLLNTNQSASGLPGCFNVTADVTTAKAINLKNNIFTNTQTNGGQHYAIGCAAASTVFDTINFNAYHTAAANAGYIGSNRATLAAIQAGFGKNTNSIVLAAAAPPVFISATDLHINASNANNIANLDNKGNPITGITTDYDTQTRNGFTPDVGADEWVKPNYGSWVGKISTDWLVPANWEANFVPDLTTDVFITGHYTFDPTIITTQAVRALALSAPAAAPLLTLNAGTLQVYGAITRTGGTIDGSNGTMEMKGSTAQTIPVSLFVSNNLKNLIISNTDAVSGVTLGGTLDIYRSVTYGSTLSTKFNTAGALTFKSNSIETAWLGPLSGSNSFLGNATVERYIPSHSRAWQFLSATATGQTINAAWQEGNTPLSTALNPGYGTIISNNVAGTGFDIIGGAGPSMKTYVPATNLWQGVAATNIPIANQKGYMLFVRGNRTVQTYNGANTAVILRTKGAIYTPASPPPVTNIGSTLFESIGNPYPSAIDFSNDVGVAKSANVQKVFYVWDPKLGTGYGAYQTFTRGAAADNNYYVSPGGGSYGAGGSVNTIIQSGQAFFVHTFGGTGTVTITETAKASGSSIVNRMAMPHPVKQLRTNLYATTNDNKVLVDGNLVEFDNSFSNGIDKLDAIKPGNTGENLGLACKGKILAVERHATLQINDTIFYDMKQVTVQPYEFEFIASGLHQQGLQGWLEDAYLHSSTKIKLNDTTHIRFAVNTDPGSFAVNRFRLVFRQQKHIASAPIAGNNISIDKDGKAAVKLSSDMPSIKVNPNPVVDKTIRLHFTNQPKGNYSIRLINNLGQQVYNSNVSVDDKNVVKNIQAPAIITGTYLLRVTAVDGTETTLHVIIE